MKRLFAAIRERGPAWDNSFPIEAQQGWHSHAAFMDALEAEGFVLLGGPLEGTPTFLLIMRAEGEDEIRSRLAEDPWTRTDQLRIARISPWTLRLGKLE
jgi:uncharacterized protein YciI